MNLEDELASAAANGNTGRVGRLLQNGADANAANSFGRTPLQVGTPLRVPPSCSSGAAMEYPERITDVLLVGIRIMI